MDTTTGLPELRHRVVVIVPIKPPARGKSRLGSLPDAVRRRLATAFALDTLAAAASTPGVVSVLAVTDDAALAAVLARAGHAVVPDGATGLNESLVQAAAEAVRRWPAARPVALLADLPCLTPADLAPVIEALPEGESFVRDHQGTGTTLYAGETERFQPRFGPGSAAAHLAGGAAEIIVPAPTVRLDVDDLADLALALEVGVGPHTASALPQHDEGGSPHR